MAKENIEINWKPGKSPQAYIGKLAAFKAVLGKRLKAAMDDAVKMVEAEAKQRVAVLTGQLRASIASMVRDDVDNAIKGYVGSDLSYSIHQEFGTSKMGASPYIRPAIEAHRKSIIDRFLKAVDEAARLSGVA